MNLITWYGGNVVSEPFLFPIPPQLRTMFVSKTRQLAQCRRDRCIWARFVRLEKFRWSRFELRFCIRWEQSLGCCNEEDVHHHLERCPPDEDRPHTDILRGVVRGGLPPRDHEEWCFFSDLVWKCVKSYEILINNQCFHYFDVGTAQFSWKWRFWP